nr:large subunit of alpha-aminoadipate reductase [Polyrhizophydium stewartii]
MRGPNVIGTRTGLQLATTHRLKPLHFVSTGSTLAHGDTLEDTDLEMSRTSLVGGYAQSKWVAEKLVMRARSRGVPATIFRPNRITGDSRNGVCNTDDFVWRLVKGAAQLGKIPRDPNVVNMSAVDHVAACLVEIALTPRSIELGAFHMHDHQGYTFDDLFGSLDANGFAVERVAHGDWRNTLEATVHSEADNALFPVLPFVLGDDPDAPEAAEEGMLDDANMQAIIADARIPVIAPDHSRITPLSLGYMVAVGFLEAPHEAGLLPWLGVWSSINGQVVTRTGRSGVILDKTNASSRAFESTEKHKGDRSVQQRPTALLMNASGSRVGSILSNVLSCFS